jgi:hypothetical protein
MSAFVNDNKEWYRFNVTDIPVDKHDLKSDGKRPGYNSGKVQIRCFINSHCPFVNISPMNVSLVFNFATMVPLASALPEEITKNTSAFPGGEGIFLTPKYVYRHSYLYESNRETIASDDISLSDLRARLIRVIGNDFSNFEEISNRSVTIGADETRYKEEQSWYVVPSVFDYELKKNQKDEDGNNIDICDKSASWAYRNTKINNAADKYDIMRDYNKEYYESTNEVRMDTGLGETADIIATKAFKPSISIDNIQMLSQEASVDCTGEGIHWKIVKKTSLFKGEDFFIEFRRGSKSTDVNRGDRDPIPFGDDFYSAIDISRDPFEDINKVDYEGTGYKLPTNYGIRSTSKNKDKHDTKTLDFSTQAYYIIEIGYEVGLEEEDHNYYIIICERSDPLFVHISRHSPSGANRLTGVSHTLSRNKNVHGSQIINAETSRITVRHHLGGFLIEFNLNGEVADVWHVRRVDRKMEEAEDDDDRKKAPTFKDKDVIMYVPHAPIAVWGGNLISTFCFGPLQYRVPSVSFLYPPKPLDDSSGSDQQVFELDPELITPVPQHLFLPMNTTHHFHFKSNDVDVGHLIKEIDLPEISYHGQKLFVQDAQFFLEYDEPESLTNRNLITQKSSYGSFWFGDTYKELTRIARFKTKEDGSGQEKNSSDYGANLIKHSHLAVRKFEQADIPSKKMQKFTMVIDMVAGDHVFDTDQPDYNNAGSAIDYTQVIGKKFKMEDFENLGEGVWILADCKTPVFTQLNLISDADNNPRWKDGTTENMGYPGYPAAEKSIFAGTDSEILDSVDTDNDYFMDATNHVMSYSDNWSASDFHQIEHTGSVSFLLNQNQFVAMSEEDIDVLGEDITEQLLSLQNKNFFIEIWAGYQPPAEVVSERIPLSEALDREEINQDLCNYTKLDGFYKLFTGFCPGGQIEYSHGKRIMTCKINDYNQVLKDQLIFNSPFYDGVKDISAVNEILKFAGFRNKYFYDPGYLLERMSNLSDENLTYTHIDGRQFRSENYALPSSYERLNQPYFKFNDGDSYYSGITKIAERAGKLFYFDQFGMAHYEDYLDIVVKHISEGEIDLPPLFSFTSNPNIYEGQLVFNQTTQAYDMSSVYNHIRTYSTTPDMTPLIYDELDWSSTDNPDQSGFIGYLKMFYQQEGMWGSEEHAKRMTTFYTAMFKPPITFSFESFGVPLRSLDIVSLNGQSARAMTVSHTINPAENKWWMNVDCERFQPINDDFYNENTLNMENQDA